jgi:hypothetical protein
VFGEDPLGLELGAEERRGEHQLPAEHEAADADVVAEQLPAPGTVGRWLAEERDPVGPLGEGAVVLTGQLAECGVQPHRRLDVKESLRAERRPHQPHDRLALRVVEIFEEYPVRLPARVGVGPQPPGGSVHGDRHPGPLGGGEGREQRPRRRDCWGRVEPGVLQLVEAGDDAAVGRDALVGHRGAGFDGWPWRVAVERRDVVERLGRVYPRPGDRQQLRPGLVSPVAGVRHGSSPRRSARPRGSARRPCPSDSPPTGARPARGR